MKIKWILPLLLAAAMLFALPISAADANEPYANALAALGLLKGTGNGYELERVTTRAEAITLVVRVLGKEEEALSGEHEHPFTDAGWADAYIGYAYEHSLIKGISEDKFGSNMLIDHRQYATLLLRVLGYSDDVGGQFKYKEAYEFALHKFAMEKGEESFTRGELIRMTYAALHAPMQNSNKTLAKALMSDRIFTQGDLSAAKAKIPTKAQKTAVLIYAVASDLESKLGMLSMDIKEILEAPSGNIEILMQTGGTKNYRNTQLHDGKTQRLRITDDALTDITVLEDANMCETQTLKDFLAYAKENVIADRYVLILWDHGEGTLGGFGRDELNDDASLSLADLKEGLAAFERKFDLVVFDACLMGTVETAYALDGVTEYMIASEDITPTDGIYYTTWLNSLSVDPKMSTEELARMIVDSFIVHAPASRSDVMLSVIRTDRTERLTGELAALMTKLIKQDTYLERLLKADMSPYGEGEGNDQYDLMAVFDAVDMDVSDLGVALEGTLYYKRSAESNKYSGLALYLPLKISKEYASVKGVLTKIGYPQEIISLLDKLN